MRFKLYKSGFTLAEVLITLGIIGVVAALTMPSVINNIQNRQLEAGFKKGYSVISQVLDMYEADNEERISTLNLGTQSGSLKHVFQKYLKTSLVADKLASFYGTHSIVIGNKYMFFTPEYTTLNGEKVTNLNSFDDGAIVTNDGMLIFFENGAGWNGNRLYIHIDVNGFNKRPNRLGYDVFSFQIDQNGRLLPMGAKGTFYYDANDKYCSQNSTEAYNGIACAYKAISDSSYFKNLKK